MQHARIVSDLGGYLALARALRVAPNVSWRWGQIRPIPVRQWRAVVRLAEARGLRHITLEGLLAGYLAAQRPANDAGGPAPRGKDRSAARAAA